MAHEIIQKPSANAKLTVNGETVELNDFVQNFISQTLIGMVSSLQGVGNIGTIELKVSKNGK